MTIHLNSTKASKLSGPLRPCPSAINPNDARRLLLFSPSPFRFSPKANARRLLLFSPSPIRFCCCPSANARRFSPLSHLPLPAATAMTYHTSTSCFLNKMPQYVPFKLKIACVYSYILFSRCLTGKSYDLQFDHNLPVYSLEQMISSGKFQYDYPVYWRKSDDISDTVGKTAGNTLTRKNKKDKMLKELSEKNVNLFNCVLKSPKDYRVYTYFCESRLKLACYIVIQMGCNYESRFFHSEKIFQKYEINLFCLDILNVRPEFTKI